MSFYEIELVQYISIFRKIKHREMHKLFMTAFPAGLVVVCLILQCKMEIFSIMIVFMIF